MTILAGTTLLNAATSTGASSSLTHSTPVRNHALQVTITGAPTAVTVELLGSLDNTNFVTSATHVLSAGELTATKAMYFVIDKPLAYVKANLAVLTGGTTPTVTVKYAGESSAKQRQARLGQY